MRPSFCLKLLCCQFGSCLLEQGTLMSLLLPKFPSESKVCDPLSLRSQTYLGASTSTLQARAEQDPTAVLDSSALLPPSSPYNIYSAC